MVVSVAVFGTVVSIAAGVFVNSLRNQRAALALMAINDNASLTIEQMAREIRVGGSFVVNPSPGPRLSFVNQRDQSVSYFYREDPGPNPPSTRKGSVWRSVANPGSPAAELPLTNEVVPVDRLTFELQGGAAANRPSRIVVVMRVGSTNPFLKNVFTDVQTTITARGE